jgi:hypothetical protein
MDEAPTPTRRSHWWTAAAVAVAVGVTLVAHRALLSPGAPALSDHPYRMAQMELARRLLGGGHDPLGLDPFTWGGYEELQWYPPGFALVGATIGIVLRLSDAGAYRLLVIGLLVLPAVSVTVLLRTVRAHPVSAAVGGLACGLLSFGLSGTYSGVGLGTVASRLSWGLGPLAVAAAIVTARQGARWWWPVALAAVTAAQLLSHPYHVLPAAAVAFGVVARRSWRDNGGLVRAAVAWAGGVAVAGVWWAGSLVYGSRSVTFAWGDLTFSTLWNPVHGSAAAWHVAIALALVVGVLAVRWRADERYRLARGLVPLLVLLLVVEHLVASRLGVEAIDPFRLSDDVYLYVVAVAALVLEPLLERPRLLPAGLVAAVLLGGAWTAVNVDAANPPVLYAVRLDDLAEPDARLLWAELAEGEGRVLFPNATVAGGLAHLMGRTGEEAGRPSLGGTSTHPSPQQPVLMYGPGATAVRDFANQYDDVSVFGLPWTEIRDDAAGFDALAGRLGITSVVVETATEPTPPELALDAHPDRFERRETGGRFAIYERRAGAGAASAPTGVELTVSSTSPTRVVATVASSVPTAVTVHVLGGEPWTMLLDGRAVAADLDDLGQPVVAVPVGEHTLVARYERPSLLWPARTLAVLLGAALVSVAAWWPWRSRSGRLPPDAVTG